RKSIPAEISSFVFPLLNFSGRQSFLCCGAVATWRRCVETVVPDRSRRSRLSLHISRKRGGDGSLLVEKLETGLSLIVHHKLRSRPSLWIRKHKNRGFLSVFSDKHSLRDSCSIAKLLQRLCLSGTVGHLLNGLQLLHHLTDRSVRPVPNIQARDATAVSFVVSDSDCLVLIELVEQEPCAGSPRAVLLLSAI